MLRCCANAFNSQPNNYKNAQSSLNPNQTHQVLFLRVLVAAGGGASAFGIAAFRVVVVVFVAAAFFGTAGFLAPGFVIMVVPALVVLPSLVLPSESCAVAGRLVCRLGARVTLETVAWADIGLPT